MKMYHEISWGKQTTKTTPNSGRSWEGYEADLFSLNTLALKCLVMSKLLASDNVSVSLAQKGPPPPDTTHSFLLLCYCLSPWALTP